ncbi:MAG: efflux RND transporter periplasmic adaptor subunit [Alphaproteobacteria bacterium]|nr:efflux RND transporter periplasmic adaptor subunit [Alphaproteobacteria bacterium]
MVENKIETGGRRQRITRIAIIAIAVVIGAWLIFKPRANNARRTTEATFIFTAIEKRDIKAQISANGNLNPVSIVNVGAQVSGIVEKILVDFNSVVRPGQLLAEIDRQTFEETFRSVSANQKLAEANYRFSELEYNRAQELFAEGFIARVEMDRAETDMIAAHARLIQANADVERARLNLGYTEIRSPVAGIVISRAVEEGQTIQASFSAPTLFVIAESLKNMQIEADISEADIGNIKRGQNVEFTVDAFPLKTFHGVVDQIRLSPTTEQNIVVYKVIIRVENKNEALLPGMTAFVDINTQEKKGVLSVPNTAFQFRPNAHDETITDYPENRRLAVGQGFVFTFDSARGRIVANRVNRGITNGQFTEILDSELREGDRVINEYNDPSLRRARPQAPRRQGGPM